jgi:hypothetical protein
MDEEMNKTKSNEIELRLQQLLPRMYQSGGLSSEDRSVVQWSCVSSFRLHELMVHKARYASGFGAAVRLESIGC